MTKEFSQSLETLKHAAHISHVLAGELAELLKLRETVANAEEAATRKKKTRRKNACEAWPMKENAKRARRAM